MQHSIVCGVDGYLPSRSAAQVAAWLARTLDLRLVLAYATEDRPTFPYGDRRLGELERRRTIEDGHRLLEAIVAELPGGVPETRVLLGTPIEGLNMLGRKEAAELMVVGSRGRGPLSAALLGSVSGRLASSAECPVLIVPAPEAAERFLEREPLAASIVCGVDGSAESERALRVAAGLAERMGVPLLPLYVDDETWEDASAGNDARVQVDHGAPVDGLGWRALHNGGKLIVVGSRGRGALLAAVLGSVSRALAATAPLPVLVVPPTARPTSFADGIGDRPSADGRGTKRPVTRDRAQEVLDQQTRPHAAVEQHHVGRFSAGIEQLPDTPRKLHTGRFSDASEQLPHRKSTLRAGRFSAGIEHLPDTPSKRRRGSFANGYDKVR